MRELLASVAITEALRKATDVLHSSNDSRPTACWSAYRHAFCSGPEGV